MSREATVRQVQAVLGKALIKIGVNDPNAVAKVFAERMSEGRDVLPVGIWVEEFARVVLDEQDEFERMIILEGFREALEVELRP